MDRTKGGRKPDDGINNRFVDNSNMGYTSQEYFVDGDFSAQPYNLAQYDGSRLTGCDQKRSVTKTELYNYDTIGGWVRSTRSWTDSDTHHSQNKTKKIRTSHEANRYHVDDDNFDGDGHFCDRDNIRSVSVPILSYSRAAVGQKSDYNNDIKLKSKSLKTYTASNHNELKNHNHNEHNNHNHSKELMMEVDNDKVCRDMPQWAKFYLNVLMHISLLMIILTLLFFLVIVPAEQKSLQNEIRAGITTLITPLLDPKLNPTICTMLNQIPTPMLQSILVGLQTQDFYTNNLNARLMTEAISMCVIITIAFIGSYVALRFSCGFCREIFSLLIENLFTFTLIGVIEYLFFTKVASKYVPTAPSFFVNFLLKQVLIFLESVQF